METFAAAYSTSVLDNLQTLLPDSLRRYRVEPSGCWIWEGPVNGSGHGQAFISEAVQTAHAAVWEALLGPVGPGVDLHHRCGNPLCVNPLHLQPQTHGNHRREHARERWAHQRADATVHLIGRRPGGKRLNEDEREEIVGLYMTRCATQGQLAHMYGVSRQTINSVIKRARS